MSKNNGSKIRSSSQAQAAHMDEEAAIHNSVGLWAHEKGFQVDLGDENMQPGAEDAVAHLKQLPPDEAIKKAREWTGRDDIHTLEDAVAAVQEALGGQE